MKTFLRILGTGASASSSKHVPSAQVFNIGNNYYMVDCGETASFWLSRFNINVCRLRKVFITHMHADHYLGLPGIIYLMDLMGAKHLQVYGPVGLKEAIEPMLKLYGHKLRMDLELIELTDGVSEVISSDDRLTVYSLPLEHSVPCIGYKFVQTDKGLEVPDEIIKEHNLDDFDIEQLEKGRLVRGLIPTEVCNTHHRFSYAYLSDTQYCPAIVPLIERCDVIYHETSFLHENALRAKKCLHSTTWNAAEIAKAADAGQLLIGHYSRRYCFRKHIQKFQDETKSVFPYTLADNEGMELDLRKGREMRFTFTNKMRELLES